MPKYTKPQRKERRRLYRKMIRRADFGEFHWQDKSQYKKKVKEKKHKDTGYKAWFR